MDPQSIQKLTANLTFLIAEGTLSDEVSVTDLQSLLDDPTAQINAGPGTQLRVQSVRRQLLLVIDPLRLAIHDQSDSVPPSPSLGDASERIIRALFPGQPRPFSAFGYNFDVIFETPDGQPALRYISDMVVKENVLQGISETEMTGASTRLYFSWHDAACQLRLEARRQEHGATTVYAHINVHHELHERDALPTSDSIKAELTANWTKFVEILQGILK